MTRDEFHLKYCDMGYWCDKKCRFWLDLDDLLTTPDEFVNKQPKKYITQIDEEYPPKDLAFTH